MIELLNRIRVFNYNADQGYSCFHALLLIIFNMRLLYLFVFNENKAPTLIEKFASFEASPQLDAATIFNLCWDVQ